MGTKHNNGNSISHALNLRAFEKPPQISTNTLFLQHRHSAAVIDGNYKVEVAGYRVTMDPAESALRGVLARKQHKTLRNGKTKLINELRAGPKTRFTMNQSLACPPRETASQIWKTAFAIGGEGDWSGKPLIGQMFRAMWSYKVNLPDEENWQPVRPLGNGSYGAASLFRHVDGSGNTDDVSIIRISTLLANISQFVVLKYTQASSKTMLEGWDSDISIEAAIMMQLNELGSDGILFLRDFKAYPRIKSHCYFMEYCPNFDLEVLRLTHKAMK